MVHTTCTTSLSYNAKKTVYISEAGMYQLIFSSRPKFAGSSNKKIITGYIKEPHATIFTGPMGFGKTHLDW